MANSKIKFKIGSLEFMSEGEQDWVTEQWNKVLDKIPDLGKEIEKAVQSESNATTQTQAPSQPHPTDLFSTPKVEKAIPENLSTFLRKKGAVEKQRRRFLGAAVWLQLNGKERVRTKEVTDALKYARQLKITNPSHQLNQNISQGFCQKEGSGFYVTPEGVDDIMRY